MPRPDASPRPSLADRASGLLRDRRARALVLVAIVVFVAVHVVGPQLPGFERTLVRLRDADPAWLALAVLGTVAYLGCYVVTLHGSIRDLPGVPAGRLGWRSAYEITMAGQAASTVITAAGAGGIALVVWALRQAGASALDAGRATATYLVLHYSVFLVALALGGSLLWAGVLPGPAPTGLTIVPAGVAVGLCVLAVAVGAFPDRFETRLRRAHARGGRLDRVRAALLGLPASLAGGMDRARHAVSGPRGLPLAFAAVGVWGTQAVILWACLRAFGSTVDAGPVVLALLVGSAANLLPLLPGGVGTVEAGLIGTLLAFGEPGSAAVVGVLAYRLISYWIPTVPEAVAYGTLRRTVARWRAEDAPEPGPAPAARPTADAPR